VFGVYVSGMEERVETAIFPDTGMEERVGTLGAFH